MPSPLTGEFDAVVQVSGLTVNRLLASLHQNPFVDPLRPRALSRVTARLGDAGFVEVVDGVRGIAWAQIGVPSIQLVHQGRDEVWMVVPVRAYFRADPGSADFPELAHGRVRAKYRLWTVKAGVYGSGHFVFLRAAVDPASVTFTSEGSTVADAQITAQVRAILTKRVGVTPQPLVDDFAAGRFMSLVAPSGESAVCHALGSGGPSTPPGDIGTVQEIFLGGRDLAVAVSREYVLGQIQPSLDTLKASGVPPFPVKAGPLTASYSATLDTASAKWSPLVAIFFGLQPVGAIMLTASGEATTSHPVLPDASFHLEHALWILFDPVSETLSVVSSGPPKVSASLKGFVGGVVSFFGGLVKLVTGASVKAAIEQEVATAYNKAIAGVLAAAGTKLQTVLGQKQKLIKQLQTLDKQAGARFDAAESRSEGFVLRGNISLSPRHLKMEAVDKLPDATGYTAFRSVIPAGIIDEYHWRWYFTTGPVPAGSPPDGIQVHADRFVLRSTAEVPGIPHYAPGSAQPKIPTGRVCLMIRGRVINEVTGSLDKVNTVAATGMERFCVYVMPPSTVSPAPGAGPAKHRRLWWALWLVADEAAGVPWSPDERLAAYVDASGPPTQRVNTLVHYVGSEAAIASLRALVEGVRTGARDDAGLLVVVVLREGVLGRSGAPVKAALTELAETMTRPLMVTEDAEQGWAETGGWTGAGVTAATRLLDPDGSETWAHAGSAPGSEIAAALAAHLRACPLPRTESVTLEIAPGDEAPAVQFTTARDPWLSLRSFRGRKVTLAFALPWARPCIAQLRRLQRLHEQAEARGDVTVAVIDRASAEDAHTLATAQRLTYLVVADPVGAIARSFGIRVWPTTVTIDEHGRIAEIEPGADGGRWPR